MHRPVPTLRSAAFSLVELSIVLVILGLLVGGVLSGQSLIRAAELRSVMEEYKKYDTAENAFKDKYFGLPGDITNATAFWGHHGGGVCANNSGTAVDNGYEMCDGNGDGKITFDNYPNENAEAYQAWSQLAHAGLVEGSFTGIAGPVMSGFGAGATNFIIGQSAPASRIANAGWALTYFDNSGSIISFVYNSDYTNWLTIGANDGTYLDAAFLTPPEAWNIDTKMDDGMPGQGKVQTWPGCSTINSGTDHTGTYVLTGTDISCTLLMKP